MKTWNRLISLVLTGAILLAVPLTSFATGANNKIKVVSKTKSSQFQVATVEVDGKTNHNKKRKQYRGSITY